MSTLNSYPLVIDGKLTNGAEEKTFIIYNPATGKELASVAEAGQKDVDRAVRAARRAFDDGPWPRMAIRERKQKLFKLAELIEANTRALAEQDACDVGKPICDTLNEEIPSLAEITRYFASLAENAFGQTIPVDPSLLNYTTREPRGVCAIITPWNYPLAECIIQWAPALACGNTIISKPAEQDPLGPLMLGQLCLEAGIPDGVVNVIPGIGPTTGAALVESALVDMIHFTGSTKTGKAVLKGAADTVKHVSAQLGSKAAMILFEDANVESAAYAAIKGAFLHQGQVCECTTRLYVQERVYETLIDLLITKTKLIQPGNPLDKETRFGAAITPEHLKRVEQAVQRGVESGAKLVCGGKRPAKTPFAGGEKGNWFLPTIFTDVKDDAWICREEIFGPVLCVMKFHDEAEAVRLANDTPYGLAAGLWTRDLRRAHTIAAQLRAGTIFVNHHTQAWAYNAPFGGYKQSGIAREFGQYSMENFTEVKHTWVALNDAPQPWPPAIQP